MQLLNSKLFFGETGDGGNIDVLFSNSDNIYVYSVISENPTTITGFPKDDHIYGYGILITINSKNKKYTSMQLYIPHNSASSIEGGYIYIRTFADGSSLSTKTWRKFNPSSINEAIS